MTSQVQTKKRTFYNILQVSNDADADAIAASYERLKSKYKDAGDPATRSELLFIEHAFDTLSEPNSRNLYDKQLEYDRRIANISTPPMTHYGHYVQAQDSWFTSSKLVAVMFGILVILAYGLYTRHAEETGKISVSKEAIVGSNEVSLIGAESNQVWSNGTVQNTSKAIDRSAEIAQRALDIQRQEAETRRMEAESRIRASEEARSRQIASQIASQKASEERQARCQYMRSLINQANHAGAYEEARAIQARGC